MSGDNIRMKPIPSFFLIVACFLLTPVQSEEKQICTQTFMCHPDEPNLFLSCTPFVGIMVMKCPEGFNFNSLTLTCESRKYTNCADNNAMTSTEKPTTKTTEKPTTKKDGSCNVWNCKLPDCKCADSLIPGLFQSQNVPQMVFVTFDDGVNDKNIDYYRKLNSISLRNPDDCLMRFTYFVSNDYNNLDYVKELYQYGHEIASHSQTHKFPRSWWLNATKKDLIYEMVGMQNILAYKSSIPINNIKGTRMPYLNIAGDDLYTVFTENQFTWDSTMVTIKSQEPIWPFTLNWRVPSKACQNLYCPKKSYAGFWEVPLIPWSDSDAKLYGMTDENNKPRDKSEMLTFFRDNFEDHYLKNRAPFGITLHATWFDKNNFNMEVLQEFLIYLSKKKDVWVIPVSQGLDWVRNPKPMHSLSDIPSWNNANCK